MRPRISKAQAADTGCSIGRCLAKADAARAALLVLGPRVLATQFLSVRPPPPQQRRMPAVEAAVDAHRCAPPPQTQGSAKQHRDVCSGLRHKTFETFASPTKREFRTGRSRETSGDFFCFTYPRIHDSVGCLFFKVTEPSSIPYRTHSTCAKWRLGLRGSGLVPDFRVFQFDVAANLSFAF